MSFFMFLPQVARYTEDTVHTYSEVSDGVYDVNANRVLLFGQHHFNPRSVTVETGGRLLTFFGYLDDGGGWKGCVYDHAREKFSTIYDWGTAADELHAQPTITVLADGKIMMIGEEAHATNGPLFCRISQNAYDLSSYTEYASFEAGVYPNPEVLNDGAVIICPRIQLTMLDCWKSTNNGQSFSKIGRIVNTTGGDGYRLYPQVVQRHINNKYQLIINEWQEAGIHRYVHYIESVDGVTWTNKEGTFSRDITSSAITVTELRGNCKILGIGTDNVLCHGSVEHNGNIYLGCRNGSSLAFVYYDNGWQVKNITNETTGGYKSTIYRSGGVIHLITTTSLIIKDYYSSDLFDTFNSTVLADETRELGDPALPKNIHKYSKSILLARLGDTAGTTPQDIYGIKINR